MKAILFAIVVATPLAAAASPQARDEPGFRARLYERYCAKLREGPVEYSRFVNRLKPIYGYGVNDFATYEDKAPLRAACRESGEKLALAMKEASPGSVGEAGTK